MNKRTFIKRGALWIAAAPFVLTPRKTLAQGATRGMLSVVAKKKAAGGGGPDVYYYGVGSDSYTTIQTYFWTANSSGDDITITTGGSLTTLGVKVSETASVETDVIVSIWTGSWTYYSCVTIAVPADHNGWVDGALGTPLTVSDSQVVRVISVQEAAGEGNMGLYMGATATGVAAGGRAYASGCSATEPTWGEAGEDSSSCRVYVD